MLAGAKLIKLSGWEGLLEGRVLAARERELQQIRAGAMLSATNAAMLASSPIVVAVATFAAYTLLGSRELTASTAFTALALFNQLM